MGQVYGKIVALGCIYPVIVQAFLP